MHKIGLQLYSIKELTQEDFLGSIKKVSEIGYDGVEFAGYFDTPAKELKKTLDDYGLVAAGSHIGIEQLTGSLEKTIEYSKEINDPFIVCPALPVEMRNSADAWKRTSEIFNNIGQKCKDNGIQFYYHNHAFEFEKFDGKYGLDILADNSDSDLVHLELDTFWVEYSGLKSIDLMKKYGARCSILHIKDMLSLNEKVNTIIGRGVMPFDEIIALGKKMKVKWYTIEQEEFQDDLLTSVDEGYKNLRSLLK